MGFLGPAAARIPPALSSLYPTMPQVTDKCITSLTADASLSSHPEAQMWQGLGKCGVKDGGDEALKSSSSHHGETDRPTGCLSMSQQVSSHSWGEHI